MRESARARFPARAEAPNWPATCRSREEIWTQVTSPPFVLANAGTESKRIRGLTRLLDWLESQPGATWQDRWRNSGAEVAGVAWRQVPLRWLDDHGRRSQWLPGELSAALKVMICADLIRPSLSWLVAAASVKGALAGDLAKTRDSAGFARLTTRCDGHSGISARARLRTLQRTSVIIAAKGGSLTDITVGDVLELLDVETEVLAGWPGDGPTLYQILHELGIFDRPGPGKAAGVAHRGPENPGRTDRPLPAHLPARPRPARGLPAGTPTRAGLQQLEGSGLLPGQPVLEGPRAAPSGTSTACTCPSRLPPPGGNDC